VTLLIGSSIVSQKVWLANTTLAMRLIGPRNSTQGVTAKATAVISNNKENLSDVLASLLQQFAPVGWVAENCPEERPSTLMCIPQPGTNRENRARAVSSR
jgi:hypothetical protein